MQPRIHTYNGQYYSIWYTVSNFVVPFSSGGGRGGDQCPSAPVIFSHAKYIIK